MVQWKLAIRYFLHRPTSWLAVLAVMLCAFIVMVVLTVMDGLVSEIKDKNHAFVGDCVIGTDSLVGFAYDPDWIAGLEDDPMIQAVSASVYGVGLVTQPNADWNIGVQFLGIDPAAHSRVTGFAESLYYHKDDPAKAFVPSYDPALPGCVVGIDLLGDRRGFNGQYYHPESLSPLRLLLSSFPLTAKGALARLGIDSVSSKTYFLSDDSHTGLPKIDGAMIYLPFDQAQLLTGMDGPSPRISSIHIRFAPGVSLGRGVSHVRQLWKAYYATQVAAGDSTLLDSVRVQSWIENRRSRIAAVEKELNMLILLFLLLALITVFIIFVIFYMLVGHKSKDLGILRSVGLSRPKIAQVFLNFAALIGTIGAAVGIGLGCLLLAYLNPLEDWLFEQFDFQLWNREVYAIGEIPHTIQLEMILGIFVCAVGACLLGALAPAWQASSKDPARVLQVNQV